VVGEEPLPRVILTGHDAPISAICVSAEHGIVISGSTGFSLKRHFMYGIHYSCITDGAVLIHTIGGEFLRPIVCEDSAAKDDAVALPVTNILLSRECYLAVSGLPNFLPYT
jgi:hypothetical protein